MAITSSGGAAGGQHKHGQPTGAGQVLQQQQQQAKKEKNKKDKKNSNRTTPVPNKPANQVIFFCHKLLKDNFGKAFSSIFKSESIQVLDRYLLDP